MDNVYRAKEISIEITEECNNKCKHCSSEAGEKWDNELSFEEIASIVEEGVYNIGTEVISLSGGEPFLRKDFLQIVEFILESGLNLLVYTCGVGLAGSVVLKEFFELVEQYNDMSVRVIVSLESDDELTHDFIVGRKDGLKEAIETIRQVVDEDIECEVHTCPMSVNYKRLPHLADLVFRLGCCRLSVLRLVPQGRCDEHDYLMLDRKEFSELQIIEEKLLEQYLETDFDIRIGDPANFLFMIDKNMHCGTCSAGKDRILIRADGSTQYCAALKHSPEYNYGNVREKSLTYLWNESDMVRRLRKFHDGGYKEVRVCRQCDFIETCKAGCLSQRINIYKDMYAGPDPLCPKKYLITIEEEDEK